MQVQTFEDINTEDIPKTDPWGVIINDDSIDDMGFEDCFINQTNTFESINHGINIDKDKQFVPLDDSKEYLANLERKLAYLQGKTKSKRENERKRLINALAMTREDHASSVINSDIREESWIEQNNDESNIKVSSLNSIDPQGTFGLMMRKLAPDHVALSADELCELLKSDILGQVHMALYSEEEEKETVDAKIETHLFKDNETEENAKTRETAISDSNT